MSGRPWLEALKVTMRERGADTDETLEKTPETLPSKGCERCESPADGPTPVVDVQTAEKLSGSWGEEERRLIAAGWKPKVRGGKIIWKRPDNGFYVSQEVSIHFWDAGIVNIGHKSGANARR
jgi:hypothetical protein